jgi:hypothetical protein
MTAGHRHLAQGPNPNRSARTRLRFRTTEKPLGARACQITQHRQEPPVPQAVDFLELHALVGDGSVASMDLCLIGPQLYGQYVKASLQRRRKTMWQANSLRGIGDTLAMNIWKVQRALQAGYGRLLDWRHQGAGHLDCQSIGAIELNREFNEACRSVLRCGGVGPLPYITDDDVARKTAGFYLMTAISRGLRTVDELAVKLRWTPRQTREQQLAKREADGEVVLSPSGDVLTVYDLAPGTLAVKHGKVGYAAALRERHYHESETHIAEIDGRELSKDAIARRKKIRALKRASRVARRRYMADQAMKKLELKPYGHGYAKRNSGSLGSGTASDVVTRSAQMLRMMATRAPETFGSRATPRRTTSNSKLRKSRTLMRRVWRGLRG